MEYKISELMELISDDSISIPDYDEVAPRRVREMLHGKIQGSGRKPLKSRHLGRTLLIAAIISLFFAVSAFAIGYSINRQRQQELREKYHVDQTGTDSYVEYPLPEDGDEVMGDGVEDIRVRRRRGGYQGNSPVRRQLRQYR